jgi:uncharacterized protein (TIGR02996 family)
VPATPPPTTDDEAFLRAIVDAPADEAPRLVYADWLDERGDPRGAYLRAVVTWGPRLHDVGTREKAERQFRHAARSLDPVWVARVTPPPVGVCCDRVRIHDRGTPIEPARIDQLEARLQIKLPPEYRAFLLNYNGGVPVPDVYEVHYGTFSRVQAFFPLGERITDGSGSASDDGLEKFALRLNWTGRTVALLPIAAVVNSYPVEVDFEEEVRRSAAPWSPGSKETCLCLRVDTSEVVCASIDVESPTGSGQYQYWTDPAAKSLPILLNQLDKLPDDWEPVTWDD